MNRKKELRFLLITFGIVIIVWIASNILHTKPSEALSPDIQQALQPITPTFDQATLDKISKAGQTEP